MPLQDTIALLDVQDLLSLPPQKWLIKGIIPEGGFVGLFGAPETGKSFVALDWALSVASGRPWLGHYPVQASPVVYVAAEGGRGIKPRVHSWMRHHGLLDVPGAYFLLNPLYVREEGTVEAFLEILEDRDIWPGLIVLDTLSRSFGGGEENASADMGHFVDQVSRLAAGRHMAAVVVHHKNATGARERGHSAFRGATDAMFSCVADRDPESGNILRVTVENDKQKDAERTPSIYMEPVEGLEKWSSLVFEMAEAPPKKETHPHEPASMRKLDMMKVLAASEDGFTFREWRLVTGIPKTTFQRRLRKLLADSVIYLENGRYYALAATKDLADLED